MTMSSAERYGSLAARAALATIFILSGFGKLSGLEGAAALIGSKGMSAPMVFAVLAGVTELTGGLMLVVGLSRKRASIRRQTASNDVHPRRGHTMALRDARHAQT
jgi:putative oxidoreductase